jgi:seryl-tRNA synthetase
MLHQRSSQLTDQDDNPIQNVWHPEPNHKGNSEPGLQAEDKTAGIISHHEVLARLEAFDTERGMSLPVTTRLELTFRCQGVGPPRILPHE